MINLICLDKVNSTNTYAKALLKSGEPLKPYTVIYAKEQTAGRGRLGRTWHSKGSDSLCMSLIIPSYQHSGITLLCALGVYDALSKMCDTELKIKWPNDIIAGNKKICGILTEGVNSSAVVGIGINLNCISFPEDIAYKATSLKLLTGKVFAPMEVAKTVATSVFAVLEQYHGELIAEAINKYSALCANIGAEVEFGGKKGIATAIHKDGSLIVSTEDNEESVSFGEVTVSGIY